MKRLLCIVLAMIMCLSLLSCGEKPVQDETTPPVPDATEEPVTDTETETKEEEPPVDPKTIWNGTLEHRDEVGFFNPDYDYSANPRYKVCFFADGPHTGLEEYDAVISHWCEKMNIEYDGLIISKARETGIELEIIANEYDGVILYYPTPFKAAAYAEALNSGSCEWMTVGEIRDNEKDERPLMRPVLNYGDFGISQGVGYLKNYVSENWPDAQPSEIGFLYMGCTGAEKLEDRERMFLEEVESQMPELSGNLIRIEMNTDNTAEWMYNEALRDNPQYKYWLCMMIMGSLNYDISDAFEKRGLTENAAVYRIIDPFDAWHTNGYEAYRTVTIVPLVMELEPVVSALYAFMNGDATPETIWGGDENGYGVLDFGSAYLVTKENYKDFLGKVNEYAGGLIYDLDEEHVTDNSDTEYEFYEPKAPDYRYDYYANEYWPNAVPFRYEDVADKTVIATCDATKYAAPTYSSVTEMSKMSPVIVVGEIIDIRYVDSNPGAGGFNYAYTIYDMKISECIHGDYKTDDIISVFEYGGYIRSGEYNRGYVEYEFHDGVLPLKMEEDEMAFAYHHANAPTSEIGDMCVMFLHHFGGRASEHLWKNTGAWTGKFIIDDEGNVSRWSKDEQSFVLWGTLEELLDIARNTDFNESLYESNIRDIYTT